MVRRSLEQRTQTLLSGSKGDIESRAVVGSQEKVWELGFGPVS